MDCYSIHDQNVNTPPPAPGFINIEASSFRNLRLTVNNQTHSFPSRATSDQTKPYDMTHDFEFARVRTIVEDSLSELVDVFSALVADGSRKEAAEQMHGRFIPPTAAHIAETVLGIVTSGSGDEKIARVLDATAAAVQNEQLRTRAASANVLLSSPGRRALSGALRKSTERRPDGMEDTVEQLFARFYETVIHGIFHREVETGRAFVCDDGSVVFDRVECAAAQRWHNGAGDKRQVRCWDDSFASDVSKCRPRRR